MTVRRLAWRLGGLALAALLLAPAQAAIVPEAQLDALVRRAYDRPDEALARLRELAPEVDPQQLVYAEARMRIHAGELEPARAAATRLAAQPATRDRALLLEALIAERQGRTAEAAEAAARALTGLETLCRREAEASSLTQGCDWRAAWDALRIVGRGHNMQGATVRAEGTARFALALARAAQEPTAMLISMGDLAVAALAQGQPERAADWIEQARKVAEDAPEPELAQARVKVYEAVLARRRGDAKAVLQAQEAALVLAKQAGAVHQVALAQSNLVDAYMHQGRAAQAVEIGMQALPVLQRFKDVLLERVLRHNLAVARIKLRQFEPAKREIARVAELREGQNDTAMRVRELRELSEAWAEAGQPKEALAVFHDERELTAVANQRNREASLEELRRKYDSTRKQRDLELLTRDRNIKDQQLGNRKLAQQVGIAVAVLFGLSLVLAVVMVRQVRAANRRLKANQALLRAQSERDPLTDLANRRHFLAVMDQQSGAQFNGALLMVDIDHFKHVNDEHGHAVGDVVICEVARRLSQAVRSEDLVVRWGGEEFLIFAPDVSQEQLAQLAERMLNTVGATPVATEDGPLRVTVSIGFAHFPLPPSRLQLHWEQAVNWADMALYTAKAGGRNRAMGIATVDARDTDALLQIEADFDAACSSERVSLRRVLGPPAP